MLRHDESLVVQTVKNLLAMWETGFDSRIRKIPWRRAWLSTPVFLPGEFHGQRSLMGYSPLGHKEWDMTERLTLSLSLFIVILRTGFNKVCKAPGLPGVTQMVKCLPAMQETRVQSLGQEDPLEKEKATHFSILVWSIPWTEEPDGLQSMGSQRVRHD